MEGISLASASLSAQVTPQRNHKEIMQTLVRIAIGNAAQGRPLQDFARDLSRLELCGVDVGDKFHNHHFAADVEMLAARLTELLICAELNMPLGGLQIPSDFSISFDGISLGSSSFSRHETVVAAKCRSSFFFS